VSKAPEKEIDDAKKFVENKLDNFLKENALNHVNWVIHSYPLADLRDVALGYIIGIIEGTYAAHCLLNEISNGSELKVKNMDVVMKVIDDNLPKIIEKIEKEFSALE
jgi:hypothetical protein